MAKEDKYILWAIALPVAAMLAIGLDLFKFLPQSVSSVLLLALLTPSAFLIYAAQKKVFTPTAKQPLLRADKRTMVDNPANKQLRKLAIVLQIVGAPLVIAAWQLIRNTNRPIFYAMGGLMLLVGSVLAGASIGILKAANE